LKSTLLTQETQPIAKADSLRIVQNCETLYVQNEEHTVDCPDCFDTMVKIYDSDRIRYYCENCDLIIPEIGVYGFIG
jgi:formamidopyrimidine-DNA glycosylase